jgi:polyisoprenoid-binding protein YceI
MRDSIRSFFTAMLLAVPVSATADLSEVPTGTYVLDRSHGYITFTYSHLGFSNPRVGFNSFDTVLELDSSNPENSAIEVTIDAASIDSRVASTRLLRSGRRRLKLRARTLSMSRAT